MIWPFFNTFDAMATLLDIQPQLLLSMPGGTELIIIAVVVLVLFGAKKIPQFAKGLGQGVKEFKDAKGTDKNDDSTDKEERKDK